jgi:hypothetical protein
MKNEFKAFPSENIATEQYNYINKGMDLRDYFAAKVLQGLVSEKGTSLKVPDVDWVYNVANAMMEAREK